MPPPLAFAGYISGHLSFKAQFGKISPHQCFGEGRRYRISAAGYLLILRILHAAVGTGKVDCADDVDRATLAGFGFADAKRHSAAINARRGYLLQILGLIYQNGDEVFQQRPHQAVLVVGAGVSSRALTTISARV